MIMDKNTPDWAVERRRFAEERLAAQLQGGASTSPALALVTEVEARRLIHELQVHQIELEMQNEELQQSRAQVDITLQRYSDLYDFAPAGYLLLDHLGVILQANLTGANMLEVNRADLVGRRLGVFVTRDDRGVLNAFIARAFAHDAKQACEVALEQTPGQSQSNCLFVRMEGSVTMNRQECCVTMIDITERKQAEQALLDKHWRMEGIIEGARVGTWEWDVQTGETVFNEIWAQLIGYTLAELAPVSIKTWKAHTHPDDLKYATKLLERHFFSELPYYDCEVRMRHKDGHWVWIHDRGSVITRTPDGKPLMMFGTHIDISARKRAEEALKSSLREANRSAQRLATLHTLDKVIHRAYAVDDIAKTALRYMCELIPATTASVVEYDAAGARWTTLAIQTDTPEITARLASFKPPLAFVSAIKTDRYYLNNDVTPRSDMISMGMDIYSVGIRSNLVVPLHESGELIGLLHISDKSPDFITAEYIDIAHEVAAKIASAMRQKRAMIRLRAHAEELERRVADRTAELEATVTSLRESEENFRTVADYTYNWEAWLGADGAYRYVSPSCQYISGHTAAEFMADPALIVRITHPDEQALLREHNHAVTHEAMHDDADLDFRILTPEGEICWVSHSCTPVYAADGQWLGRRESNREITERKHMEARLHILFNDAPDPIILLDKDYMLRDANHAYEIMTGYMRAELVGKDPRALGIVSSDDSDATRLAQATLARGQGVFEYIVTVCAKNGACFDVEISMHPVMIDAERMYLASLHDISARKQAESMMIESMRKLEELNQLKTRFVSVAAHQFRTPLATISLTAENLSAYRARMNDAKIEVRLSKIVAEVKHMQRLIDDLLHLTHMQSAGYRARLARHDLDAACREIVDQFHLDPQLKHTLAYASSAQPLSVMLDAGLIKEAITNLVDNAIKYSPAGSVVTMALTTRYQQVELRVSDQGIGIPPVDQPHLFHPFYRGSNINETPGTGLGLSIVKNAIELHGGTITVESEVGRGTTFTVMLPRNDEA